MSYTTSSNSRIAQSALVYRLGLFGALATLLALTGWSSSSLAQDTETVLVPDDDDSQIPAEAAPADADRETICDNRVDEDGDGMVDCADSDCFLSGQCNSREVSESTNERCSDWIDNDGDGQIDCDDASCEGVPWCTGSMYSAHDASTDDGPELEPGESTLDFVGAHGDAGGERNDFQCSDGIDNDNDGRVDCEDFGCRYDPAVRVCQGPRNYVFSVVAGIGASFDLQTAVDGGEISEAFDVNFTRLQLRVLGQIPFIEDSFFLLSMRMEKSPRLTFANFQVPLGERGWILGLNSGGGNLSTGLILSAGKRPLLDPAFYVFNAFEQGNGAAIEVGGPIDSQNRFRLRFFAAGGSGEFNGNVGGRFFRDDRRNISWSAGMQFHYNAIGYFDRFDSRVLYLEAPTTLAFLVGAKFDQRADERYPAFNALAYFSWERLMFTAEGYLKYEIDFEALQGAWNVMGQVLLIPRRLSLAMDVGQFRAQNFNGAAGEIPDRPLEETQWRVALNYFWFRDRGLATLLYSETHIEDNPSRPEDATIERELRLEFQFRF